MDSPSSAMISNDHSKSTIFRCVSARSALFPGSQQPRNWGSLERITFTLLNDSGLSFLSEGIGACDRFCKEGIRKK